MKKLVRFFIIIFIIFVVFVFFFDDEEDEGEIVNIGNDTYTLMVYMCASDLESEDGSASADLQEMLEATVDEKVNVIIETGGTREWQDFDISNETNQIYKVEKGELKLIKDDLGLREMVDPNTLADFIKYTKENYPADHYGLIMWDHGGGSVSGYGYDELSQDEEDTLTIDELQKALSKANVKFDFIGFDACLMATAETAFSLKNYSKYLIASEETEPGSGWEYKSLINQISRNTSQDPLDILKKIVTKYISSNNGLLDFDDATLSIIDLSKIDNLYNKLYEFMLLIEKEDLDNNKFVHISKSVDNTKSFAEGECDIIDLYDFAEQINNSKSKELIKSIEDAVTYYENTDLVENTHGISLYFPYKDLTYYDDMIKIYSNIGIDSKYINVLTKFVNIMAGGKKRSYTINSHDYDTEENYDDYNWYNQDIINDNQSLYDETELDDDTLEIVDKGKYYVLELTKEDWEKITNITCEVFYDDGEGFIDLGSDDYYELDKKNNLKITFDKQWVFIENQLVPFYILESNDKYSKGEVYADINGEESRIIILRDDKNPSGKILGYEPISYGNTTLSSKGLSKLKKGDKIEFVFDYYTYDGEYDDSYIIGDTITVGKKELTVSYDDVGEGEYYVYYKITDIYNNSYYTEAVIFD